MIIAVYITKVVCEKIKVKSEYGLPVSLKYLIVLYIQSGYDRQRDDSCLMQDRVR